MNTWLHMITSLSFFSPLPFMHLPSSLLDFNPGRFSFFHTQILITHFNVRSFLFETHTTTEQRTFSLFSTTGYASFCALSRKPPSPSKCLFFPNSYGFVPILLLVSLPQNNAHRIICKYSKFFLYSFFPFTIIIAYFPAISYSPPK